MGKKKKNKNKKEKVGFFKRLKNLFFKTKEFFEDKRTQFIIGVLLAVFAVFFCFSYVSFFSAGGSDQDVMQALSAGESGVKALNSTGIGGALLAEYLVNDCFGLASIMLFPLIILWAIHLMHLVELRIGRWTIIFSVPVIWSSIFFSFVLGGRFDSWHISPGGAHGELVTNFIERFVGPVGVVLLLFLMLLFYMVYLTAKTIPWLREKLSSPWAKKPEEDDGKEDVAGDESEDDDSDDDEEDGEEDDDEEDSDDDDDEDENEEGNDENDVVIELDDGPSGEEKELSDEELAKLLDDINKKNAGDGDAEDGELPIEVEEAEGDDDTGGDMLRPINPKDELSFYKPPTLDLLDEYEQGTQAIDRNEQAANANKIVEVLKNFGIDISSIKATVGPTITLYEITPAPGVRISKIRNLEDDIAMSLSALCIRIVAPIPGKGTIGIEVPNAHKQIVPMASLLNSRKYKETDMALPLALGKTISNEVYMVDMAKMPHLLVAGATGMGKSVGLNAIITSLLYKMHPAYLKFVMVDPKMVELSLYGVLEKHFLAKLEGEDEPIITDVNKVVRTLKSLCVEMDNRYKLLQLASVRSVKEYNEKFLNKELLPTKGHRFMPYIVVIIDEYGDLMMTAGREVEQPIARIAQKARAVGIHMIIATQRPTTNIITGTIKANFPARMAFRVISAIDSRTILDRSGANQLQGRGDMLFLAGNDPVRVQCALVETKEVERVCAHIAKQQGYQQAYILPEPDEAADFGGDGGGTRGEITSDKLDPLFAEAARAVVLAQHGSTSLIQRKFNVGFNRAGRIMDQLCQTGIVGEQEGSKPRQVLCADEADLEFRLKSLLQ